MTSGRLDRLFGLGQAGSTLRTELRAGVTTFLTMAYILVVNPAILGQGVKVEGVDLFGELLTATALAAALGTLLMGLWARYPFATAPGMGLNAYFATTVVIGMGVPWQTALGAVFISGVVFFFLSIFGVRELIVRAIPRPLGIATAAGIGLFLAHLGAQNGGLVVGHEITLVTMGDIGSAQVQLTLVGVALTAALLALKVRGAILIGIVGVTALAMITAAPVYQGAAFGGFEGLPVAAPNWPQHIAGQLDLAGAFELGLIDVVFVFLFVDFFDTAGTLLGLSHKVGAVDADGRLPRANRAFGSDALATCAGALFGVSTTTSYIESAAGIQEGGKTGLTAVVVALLFLLSLFLWPLFAAIPAVATAPALIVVGASMLSAVGDVCWADVRQMVPVFLTIILMPLTYSIANGITVGILAWVAIHAASGRWRDVHWLMYLLGGLLVARFVWLAAGG